MEPGKGVIFNIQKFCVNDGPGIRTTVFFKGCPLRCIWCHNPESNQAKKEIFFDAKKCIGCGACLKTCEKCLHQIGSEGEHLYDRGQCVACGVCAENCVAGALEQVGEDKTVEEILAEVKKDEVFYQTSGGGMTVSGGEPLAQFAFVKELLKRAKEEGLHTCMETCGYTTEEKIREIAPLVDLFLFDYKETDAKRHEEYTGVSNEQILKNLFLLDELGVKTILRCPIIPTLNDRDDHFAGIAATANQLKNVQEIHIEPYHPLGSGKSEMLGKEYRLKGLTFPEESTVTEWIAKIQAQTEITVKKA